MRTPSFFEWLAIEKRDEYLNTPLNYTIMDVFKHPYLIVQYPEHFEIIDKAKPRLRKGA